MSGVGPLRRRSLAGRAFTLVEVVVSLLLVATLSLIAVVGYGAVTDRAQRAAAQAVLSSAGTYLMVADAAAGQVGVFDRAMVVAALEQSGGRVVRAGVHAADPVDLLGSDSAPGTGQFAVGFSDFSGANVSDDRGQQVALVTRAGGQWLAVVSGKGAYLWDGKFSGALTPAMVLRDISDPGSTPEPTPVPTPEPTSEPTPEPPAVTVGAVDVRAALADDGQAVFTWSAVENATSYLVSSTVDGKTSSTEQTQTSFTVRFAPEQGASVTVRVTPAAGAVYGPADSAAITAPAWKAGVLESGWVNRGQGWATAKFTRTAAGVVALQGFVQGGTWPATILTLPVGYRPATSTDIYFAAQNTSRGARINISADGKVQLFGSDEAQGAWVSLSGITFLAADAPGAATAMTLQNGWQYPASSWSRPEYKTDGVGRVHLRGFTRYGTTTAGTAIAAIPDAGVAMRVQTRTNGGPSHLVIQGNKLVTTATVNREWVALSGMYYPASMNVTWAPIALSSDWSTVNGAPAQMTKARDGLVSLRGSVRAGSGSNVLGTLPEGYRPARTIVLFAAGTGADGLSARFHISPNGTVAAFNVPAGTTVTLDNVHFMGEQ